MTPDVLSPTSKTSDRKLKAVEQWVHEVTLETQQQDVMVENTAQRLPVVTLPAGGREGVVDGECRLAVCPEDMASRKVLDLRRWYCMSRPQYSRSCGISSVVSCWNYIFSTIGNGNLPPITQEEALALLGFKKPYGEIRFGPFTGNATVMRWFKQLCNHRGVVGKAYYFYKPVGKGKTFGLKPEQALTGLKEGLREPHTAFIYHCWNHYFCPVGFEEVPKHCQKAYSVGLRSDEVDSWILIGEPSRKHPGIHCKKWEDIVTDLTCESPQWFNIRHPERGVQTRKTRRQGRNLHCIMGFQMQRTSEWEIADSTLSPEPPKAELGVSVSSRSRTPVETLDSSESDFPHEPEASSDVDANDLLDTLQSDDEHVANFPGMLDGAAPLLSSIENEGKKSEVVEEADAPQTVITPATPKVAELTSDKPDYQQPSEQADDIIDEEDQLNRTLTPTEEDSPYGNAENGPLIDVESLQPEEGDYIQRTGTYRKSKPSLSPDVRPGMIENEHQLETNSAELTGDYTRRSGTFRKEKPSLLTTPQTSITDVNGATSTAANNQVVVHSADTGEQLEDDTVDLRRDNSPLVEPLTVDTEEPDLHNVEVKSSEQKHEHSEGSGLKRSGTFRKEKPTLEVSPIVRTDRLRSPEYRNDASQPEGSDYSYTSKSPILPYTESPVMPAVSLTVPEPLISPYSTPSPAYVVYPESDSSDSAEESYVLVDDAAVSGGGDLKRSGTFTKERSVLEHSPFGDEYF
jgi:hypothetical protein